MRVAGTQMDGSISGSQIVGHVMSGLAVLGSLAGYLPAVAALAGLVWYLIQMWESKTVQNWVRTRRERRLAYHHRRATVIQASLSMQQIKAESGGKLPDLPEVPPPFSNTGT